MNRYSGPGTQKQYTFSYADVVPGPGTSGIPLISPITAGSALWQRVGRRIAIQGLDFAIGITDSDGSTYEPQAPLRLTIVYDKQPKVEPNIADVYNGYNETGSAIGYTTNSERNPDNIDRFTILYDKKWTKEPFLGANAQAPRSYNHDFLHRGSIPLHNATSVFSSTSPVSTGEILLFYNTLDEGDESMSIQISITIYFKDVT